MGCSTCGGGWSGSSNYSRRKQIVDNLNTKTKSSNSPSSNRNTDPNQPKDFKCDIKITNILQLEQVVLDLLKKDKKNPRLKEWNKLLAQLRVAKTCTDVKVFQDIQEDVLKIQNAINKDNK